MEKPAKLVCDLESVWTHGGGAKAMAYVMLSRVQCIEQLFILKNLDTKKFIISEAALEEHARMEKKSLNNRKTLWETDGPVLKISFLNIHSLEDKMSDLAADTMLLKSDIIALGETWLPSDVVDPALNLSGYQVSLNSWGRGSRGVATYYKSEFTCNSNIKTELIQITKLSSEDIDVVNIYRSPRAATADDSDLVARLGILINQAKFTILVGDFNICYRTKRGNVVIVYLESLGFKQLTTRATHSGGGVLDLVFVNKSISSKYEVDIQLYSPYYTCRDHDCVLVTVNLVSTFVFNVAMNVNTIACRLDPALSPLSNTSCQYCPLDGASEED